MKSLAVSIALALTLSAPALAQSGPNPPSNVSAEVIDETMILEATTAEDRAAMLRRCAGPPPRLIASEKPKQTPVSEPVAVAEKPSNGSHSGGGD